MAEATVKKDNHALRTVTAIFMFFIAITHYYSQFKIGDMVFSDALTSVGRFVIPVFAMISGYFLFSKDGHSEAKIKSKALHILVLILIFKAVYLIFSLILCVSGIVNFDYVLTELLTVSPAYYFDCYGGTVGIMTTQPIWFVYSLFLVYGLWFLFHHFKIDFKWTWVIALPILVFALAVVDIIPMFGTNDFLGMDILGDQGIGGILYPFIVLPFFGMGYYLHKHKEWIDSWLTNTMIWVAIFASPFIIALEAYLRGTIENPVLYIGSLLLALSLFLGTFRVPEDKGRIQVLIYIGKHLTVWMYVFFAMANFIMRYAFQTFADDMVVCEVVGPVLALILDIAMAFGFHMLLRYMSDRKKAKAGQVQVTA